MKQRIHISVATLLVAGFSLLALNSCKEDTIINASIVPVGDTINTSVVPDTLTILSKNYFEDSLVTSLSISGLPSIHALGTVSDPSDLYTGKVYGSIYFQIVPPKTGFSFVNTPDSAVLVLPYSGFTWGDTTGLGPQTFTVYEVTDSLSKDSTYYGFTYKNVNRAAPLGFVTVNSVADLKDSVMVNGIKTAPHLRITLSPAFVASFKAAAAAGTNFADNPTFLRWFKGLCIEPDTNNGRALYYFRLDGDGDYTRANVQFYHTEQANGHDTVIGESFRFNPDYAAHFNRVRRNYNGTEIKNALNSTTASNNVFFIQNAPGVVADLKFPFIKNLPHKPINKAELIITQVTLGGNDKYNTYFPPERLFPTGVDVNGRSYTVLDRFPTTGTEPLEFINGKRYSVTIAGVTYSQYLINIPREVQKAIVEQRDTLHLRIAGASGFPGAYRLTSGGRGFADSSFRVRLNIIYSKI